MDVFELLTQLNRSQGIEGLTGLNGLNVWNGWNCPKGRQRVVTLDVKHMTYLLTRCSDVA